MPGIATLIQARRAIKRGGLFYFAACLFPRLPTPTQRLGQRDSRGLATDTTAKVLSP